MIQNEHNGDDRRETDRAMWAIACLLATGIVGGLTLAVLFALGVMPWTW